MTVRSHQETAMHILLAANDEVEPSLDAAIAGVQIVWRVPKNALVGDDCVLNNWTMGIYAVAEIQTEPRQAEDRHGVYEAEIGNIQRLGVPLPLAIVAERLPAWKWPTYPRTYTTVPKNFEMKLRELIAEFQESLPPEIDEEVSVEGAATLRLHMVRERDSQLANQKKAAVLAATGDLKCEVCNFDFALRYGEIGKGFCEVHHLTPISRRAENTYTRLEDLAIVCSNCHRMLHRRGLISMLDLRKVLLREA